MSTAAEPTLTPPTPTTPSTAAPGGSSGAGAAPTAATPKAEPFRFGAVDEQGNAIPEWAQGKTPAEVLAIGKGLEQTLRDSMLRSNPAPAPQPTAPTQPDVGFDPNEYLTGARLNEQAPRLVERAMQPHMEQVFAMTAENNLETVRRENADVFSKWGPEVYGKLAHVPKNQWTLANLRTVANMVKADHVTELARVEAERIVAEMGGTLRSSGAALPSVPTPDPLSLTNEKVSADWRDRAAKLGITDSTVEEWCRVNGISREQFFKDFEATAITEVTRRG